MFTPTALLYSVRNVWAGTIRNHPALAAIVTLTAVAIVSAAITVPVQVSARNDATARIATVVEEIDALDMEAATLAAELTNQIRDGRELINKASAKGAVASMDPVDELQAQVEMTVVQRDALRGQREVAAEEVREASDSTAILARDLAPIADTLTGARDALAQTVAGTQVDLSEAEGAVKAEMKAKKAADKKAAEKKRKAAEKRKAEEAARLAAEEAAAAEQAQWQDYSPQQPEVSAPGPKQQQSKPKDNSGGGNCRAVAEGIVASIAGASVTWTDLGVSGNTGAGLVYIPNSPGVQLSSGTNDSFWCTPTGAYVSAHEAVHSVHSMKAGAIHSSGGMSLSDQMVHSESAADCGAAMLGYTGSVYGCTPQGKKLAKLILG